MRDKLFDRTALTLRIMANHARRRRWNVDLRAVAEQMGDTLPTLQSRLSRLCRLFPYPYFVTGTRTPVVDHRVMITEPLTADVILLLDDLSARYPNGIERARFVATAAKRLGVSQGDVTDILGGATNTGWRYVDEGVSRQLLRPTPRVAYEREYLQQLSSSGGDL